MIRTAIITQTAAAALCLLLTQYQPAHAGMMQTASNGAATWTYTAGEGGSDFKFTPIQGADWSGGSGASAAAPLAADLAVVSDPTAVPEPGTLALLALPLLFGAAVVRRRQQR